MLLQRAELLLESVRRLGETSRRGRWNATLSGGHMCEIGNIAHESNRSGPRGCSTRGGVKQKIRGG